MSTEANKVETLQKVAMGDNRRYVLLAQAAIAIGVFYILGELIYVLWRTLDGPNWTPFGFHIARVISFAVTGSAFIYTLRNPVAQDFCNEVVIELRKVTWPTFKETRQATMVVILVVAIVSLILGGFDFIWANAIKWLLKAGGASS